MNSNVLLDDVMKMADLSSTTSLFSRLIMLTLYKNNFQVALRLKMVMANYLSMLQFLHCLLDFSYTQPLFCTLHVRALNST